MYRDYTEAAFSQLKKQIQEINDTEFCWLIDALEDLRYLYLDFIGTLDIENYINDVSEYHQLVLDQHNTTVDDLKRIFNAVRDVDSQYATQIGETHSSLSSYVKYMRQMEELIDPTATNFNAATIRGKMDALSQEITDATTQLDTVYEESIDKRAKQIAKEAALGFLVDAYSGAKTIFDFCKKVRKGDTIGVAKDIWKSINCFFQTMGDVVALLTSQLGLILGRDNAIGIFGKAEESSQWSDVADILESENHSGLMVMARIIDAACSSDFTDFFSSDLMELINPELVHYIKRHIVADAGASDLIGLIDPELKHIVKDAIIGGAIITDAGAKEFPRKVWDKPEKIMGGGGVR